MTQLSAQSFEQVARSILDQNETLDPGDSVLILSDESTQDLAGRFLAGIRRVHGSGEIHVFPDRTRSGEEPPAEALQRLLRFDAVFCLTKHSLTHTAARKKSIEAGKLFITMPGITEQMFTSGALTADYARVERETAEMAERLTRADEVVLHTGTDHALRVPVAGRDGIASTGVYRGKGMGGNLPSGEAYLAPLEYRANGTLEVNGSIAGIGLVDEPVVLTVEEGRLVSATGATGARLLELLGDGLGRQVAELGIGTNHKASLIGAILEDEKAYGTAHVAFGSNNTFGGTIAAGVHIDCVVAQPRIEWVPAL